MKSKNDQQCKTLKIVVLETQLPIHAKLLNVIPYSKSFQFIFNQFLMTQWFEDIKNNEYKTAGSCNY